ncbi:general secretion pathway protein GspE [Archangium primigenium]|nr:general secretion pathway protein GspE [Archangium primigenium]
MQMTRKRLGEILLEKRMVDSGQLNTALTHHRHGGAPLGQVMLDLRLCTATQLLEALALQTGVPMLDLDREPLDPALGRQVPRRLAERHRLVPLRLEGPRDTVLVVAIAAPASLQSLEAVRTVTNKSWVVPKLVTDEALARALERLYGPAADADDTLVPGLPLPEDIDASAVLADALGDTTFEGLLERTLHALPEVPRTDGLVLVYGWRDGVGEALVRLLAREGHRAAVATEGEVLTARKNALVLAPLPWLEVLPRRPRARLLAAGKDPLRDGERARRFGAHGFLPAAPLDEARLRDEVRRLLGEAHGLQD